MSQERSRGLLTLRVNVLINIQSALMAIDGYYHCNGPLPIGTAISIRYLDVMCICCICIQKHSSWFCGVKCLHHSLHAKRLHLLGIHQNSECKCYHFDGRSQQVQHMETGAIDIYILGHIHHCPSFGGLSLWVSPFLQQHANCFVITKHNCYMNRR